MERFGFVTGLLAGVVVTVLIVYGLKYIEPDDQSFVGSSALRGITDRAWHAKYGDSTQSKVSYNVAVNAQTLKRTYDQVVKLSQRVRTLEQQSTLPAGVSVSVVPADPNSLSQDPNTE